MPHRSRAVDPGYPHPVRIVSLTCSNTEIVCALGMAHTLVGVDDHSDYPPEVVAALPRVGPDLGIDVAKVAALRPDWVLASLTVPGHERVVAAVEAAGLRYVAPAPLSIADVYRDIRDIGALLGVPDRAEALVDTLTAGLTPMPATGRRVLVEWWPKPVIAAGHRSWIEGLVTLAGGENALTGRDCISTPLTDDEVVALAPDVVVVAWCGVPFERYRLDVVYRRPAWQGLRALQERRVVPIAEAWLGRPGPRLLDGYHALRRVLEAP
jgi:iron complex transport system substrate-binding protein